MSDTWLSEALAVAQPLQSTSIEVALIRKILNVVDKQNYSIQDQHIALAAAFDLLVAAEYYSAVAHVGWVYCPKQEPLLLYPYTNTCPRCILDGTFEFHKANKPKSGSIGATTSRLLSLFMKELLQRKGLDIEILKGGEPIDAIFVDRTTNPITLFFAEIKASPLTTLPLVLPAQQMTIESDSTMPISDHRDTDLPTLFGTILYLYIPEFASEQAQWIGHLYALGCKQAADDKTWAYQGFIHLLDNETFFHRYLSFWQSAFRSYEQRDPHPTYWFTNGCGQPIPRPDTWPRRTGTGYESVSDSKTSVGMDRTDDIKKGTYQVLKLGSEGNPSTKYNYKTGIVSNIHAVRHFENYLTSLKDIVWTREPTGRLKRADQLAPDTPLFNLFDGIITLTGTIARDAWVERIFSL